MLNQINSRLKDYLHEKQIEALQKSLASAVDNGERYRLWVAMKEAINSRSPEQVKRMERKAGLVR